ncbi:TPA: hypothetical protein TUD09_002090 [Streptococcus equi subsp. zooepidemicus]|uniref:Uncharacterized protein n=1 Tax=Streptococcus equi subsp. ruminatorum CECT 5772 TaxID=1051981 RepID=A0A922T4T7_9STRE|nr:hypothetical protein [Streptococcus equi]HEL0245843.1 hypothetical protein [Streptococcus equi subsp. zooepidemicus]HEL1010981.1 hypothetical protein [Streptococcus equi subsp. ruminatorum]KED03939.1 hypothetical protein CECT5772_07444 [Streptococcus equi subsp. ruminatorum CECT 5772]HEL0247746.1 hypothetical protein [Streptococcus equi subsp. zooepidemicus]HEL1012949.1 hypothetical protein [Streptococcus equi subsp. ruminatorum]
MNDYQENQLLSILSDFIPLMDGDIIQGISPEAGDLTRQKVLEQLIADRELLNKEDISLVSWQEENIQLLEAISDDDFQTVVNEKIIMTELQIGQSLFQPLNENQLERLAEKLTLQKEKSLKNQLVANEKEKPIRSFLKHFFN